MIIVFNDLWRSCSPNCTWEGRAEGVLIYQKMFSYYLNGHLPRMFWTVDLKSSGSIPSLKDKLEMSEQLLMADNFRCMSVDSFRPTEILRFIVDFFWKINF